MASQVTQRYLEPGSRPPVIFRGAPGTGKTVRLQEIAVAHARAGRAVLFTCFNKVLASTLRGIMSTQRLGEDVDRRVVVTHVDELMNQLDQDDLDAFGGLFGTICVDEAQDMGQDRFEFLERLAGKDAEWFLADGPGQELYNGREPSAFLIAARERGEAEVLRRNFRNSAAGFVIAQAVYEHAPDPSAIADWVRQRPMTKATVSEDQALDLGVEFSRSTMGELPVIVRLDVPRGQSWRAAKLDGYTAVFHKELEQLAAEGRRRDLAVLCARGDNKSAEPQLAREAFARLGVPVHDQIDDAGRGLAVPKDHVRLATIHSSRGVEASRVVILDWDQGISVAERHEQNSRIMTYIALSRAQHATTVVALEDAENPYLTFLEQLVRAYGKES